MASARLTFLLLFLSVLAVSTSYAATLTVNKIADTADGSCDAVDRSLREAVASAGAGDMIVFSELFTSSPQIVALSLGQISVSRDLSIQGPGAAALLNISGSNLTRIFNISGGANVSIAFLTISDGLENGNNGDSRGGGIIVSSSSLTVSDVVFHHNLARYPIPPTDFGEGGAIFGEKSFVTVTNCEFYNNTATGGGAAVRTALGGFLHINSSSFHNNIGRAVAGRDDSNITVNSSSFIANSAGGLSGSGTLLVTGSLIEGNYSGPGISTGLGTDVLTIDHCVIRNNLNLGSFRYGGGISASGMAIIRSSVISGNRAGTAGGGIYNTALMYIEDSSVTGNFAGQKGGGIFNAVSRLHLTNSTVSSNQAPKGGGVLNEPFDQKAPPTYLFLTNSTISFNAATAGAGGGILTVAQGVVETQNSVISSNTSTQGGADVSGTVNSGGFNLVQNTAGSTGWTTTDLLGIDPLLAPLGSNGGNTFTHALLPGSPAINAGSNTLAVDPQNGQPLATDQRGMMRILGGSTPTVDIGAYEANYAVGPVNLEGRLLTMSGGALPYARVVLTGGSSEPRYAITNPFGYYRFFNLEAGQTYTIAASAKFYSFAAPLIVTADQDRNDLLLFGGL